MASAKECMDGWRADAGRPKTPERVRKWRVVTEPGARVLPPGQRDGGVDATLRYGARGSGNRDSGIFGGPARPPSPLRDFVDEQVEGAYPSRRRAARTGPPVDADKAFGCTTKHSESAGEVIWTAERDATPEGAVAPPRRPRGTDLAGLGIDREAHAFGGRRGRENDASTHTGTSADMLRTFDMSEVNELAAEADRRRAELSARRRREPPPDIRFGAKGAASDVWDARACILGDYAAEAIAPDETVGVSMRRRSLVATGNMPPGANERRFGVTSIRSDLPPPRVRSVADVNNYGDEVGGKSLLYPTGSESLVAPRAAADARAVLEDAGMGVDDETWARMLRSASAADGDETNTVTVDELRQAYNSIVLGL